MVFEQIRIGGDRNFAYLVGDEQAGQAASVDVGCNPQTIVERLDELGLTLKYIIGTHSHCDHIDGHEELKNLVGGEIVMHESVSGVDKAVADGETLEVGRVKMQVIHCPGHSPDSIALLVDGKTLISGDELFVGKIGGTRTPEQARTQYDSLHAKLLTLADDVAVYPGHDYGTQPTSTIGRERQTNPFLQRETFEDFLWLKDNWAQYKREHGIA